MKRLSFLFLLFTCCVSVYGYWVPFEQRFDNRYPSVGSLKMVGNDTVFTLHVPGIEAIEKTNDSNEYILPEIPENGWLMQTGAPQIPAIRKNIIVPPDAVVDLKIDVIDAVQLDRFTVWPVQPSTKRSEPLPPFTLDSQIYQQNAFYPADWGRISQDAWMRDFRFVTIEINPLRINPVTEELLAATNMTITITTNSRQDIGPKRVFPTFYSLYKSHLLNFDLLNIGIETAPEPMLVICHSSLISDMALFIDWKTKRGIDARLVSSDISGTTGKAIYSYLQYIWNTWDSKPVYILLVGDGPQLQPLFGIASCASDSKFTLLEGSDLIPDALISRLSAQNSDELNAQLDKILTYEQTPPEGFGTWLDKFAGLACNEGSGPTDEEYSQEMEACLLMHNPDATADRIYQSLGHGEDEIREAVNEGRFWVSYLGHGGSTYWVNPRFHSDDVDALTNGYYTPFVVDGSCSNGYFIGPVDCFAEHWMKNSGKGAIGMFSSSTSCSWHEPAQMFLGLTYSLTGNTTGTIPGGNYILGQMILGGILHMYDFYGVVYGTEDVMNQYVLFGDCSLMFRSDAYMSPVVSHPSTISMGKTEFMVSVGDGNSSIEDAVVCVWKDNDIHQTRITGQDGIAVFELFPQTPGDVLITVSGQNIFPQQSLVTAGPAECGVIVLDQPFYNCSENITLSVYDSDLNTNPTSIQTVTVTISSDSNPLPVGVLLTETGPNTAEFVGTIMTSKIFSGNGYLRVVDGDMIQAVYLDQDCEGEIREITETVFVDCQGPIISNVTVAAVTVDSLTVSWNTDEPALTGLIWGDQAPPENVVTKQKFTTEHSVFIKDLDGCSIYYFSIFAIDRSRNRTDDFNNGSYYFAITKELKVIMEQNMDTDPEWIYENLWEWGPASGILGNPPSGYTGTHIVGYNLDGYYQNDLPETYLTTTPFDCSDVDEVIFSYWRWLNLESWFFDHASVEISNDGGSTWNLLWRHIGGSLYETRWSYHEFDITDWAAGYSDVRLRWCMGPTDYMAAFSGWNIDDVLVSCTQDCTSVSTPTPAPTYTPTPLCIHNGDINGDDVISANDAQLAFMTAIGLYSPTFEEECAADCNGDGVVSAEDAQLIFLAGLGSASCWDPL
ncbi:MAG: C25 family cysteine peptidase [bacterium]